MVDLMDAVDADVDGAKPAPGRRRRLTQSRAHHDEPRDWKQYAPLLLVAVAVAFGVWLLRAELQVVAYANDATTHESMARLAARRIRGGHLPFDTWFSYLGVGSPQFLQYQALGHSIVGLLSIPFGDSVFQWVNYLLVCSWPISVYAGARLLGLDRWEAATAALVSPMLVNINGYGFEWGSFIWAGSGMSSMLWAIWFLPLAMGLAWRAVSQGERYALAAFVVGLTCALHFLTGYLVLLSIGVFVLVRPRALLQRAGRSAVVAVGGLLIFAFVFVPTVVNLDYVDEDSFQAGTFWVNSYGPGKVFTWLFHGQVFDYQRHPVVSVLVGVGAIVCLLRSRRREAARVPLGLMALCLALWSGRGVVGVVLDRLPGGSDVLLHRYIIGVHFAGMLLAGIGAVWAFRFIAKGARFVPKVRGRNLVAPGIACVLAALLLWPVLGERKDYAAENRRYVAQQLRADETSGVYVAELIALAKERGGGRIYAGLSSNWGHNTKVGFVQLYHLPTENDVDSIGFLLRTDSLSAEIEAYFNEADPAAYDLFSVRYVLLPPNSQPSVPASLLATRGSYTLWEVKNVTGYLEVIDTTEPVAANRKTMTQAFGPGTGFLSSPALAQHRHALVAFDGRSTPTPSASVYDPFIGFPGQVDASSESLDNGRFEGTVTASRPAWVMLKQSYYPHWKATVDGKPVKTAMVAASFVAVPVPAGTHHVVFQYQSQRGYPAMFAFGLLVFLGLALGPKRWKKYRESRGVTDEEVAELPAEPVEAAP